jgi:uracil-DNA glycosylase
MTAERSHLLQHLQNALFGYGGDLLLAMPARKQAASPSPESAAGSGGSGAQPSRPRPWERRAEGPTAARPQGLAPPIEAPAKAPTPGPRATPGTKEATPAAANAAATMPEDALLRLRAQTLACTKCKLCDARKTVVFGEGARHPEVMFVGEAPGAVEDQTGRPFVGPAGQLLDRILEGAMGYRRDEVYIANINKCRPPGNRDPEPDEVAACIPILKLQIALLRPKVLVALGRVAAHNLLGTDEPMRALRGRELRYEGIPVVVTWHPAFLLRDPSRKPETWADIKRVNRMLGRPEDPRQAQRSQG